MPDVAFFEKPRHYTVDGEKVPSVTQILGILDKPGLPWWGMTVGVKGICELARRYDNKEIVGYSPDELVAWLTSEKQSVNHVRDEAATRGVSLHTGLELWMREQRPPSVKDFPKKDRGYVQALAKALIDLDPEPIATEVVVGSAIHKYAGRYDLKCRIGSDTGILDLKTSKKLYDTVHLQLAAYALADYECGNETCTATWALRLAPDGTYEFVETVAAPHHFLGVLKAYEAMQNFKEVLKDAKREWKAAA